MALRGPVRLGPLPPSSYCCIISFSRWSEGYGPTGSGTVVPPPSLLILRYSLVLKVEWRVWSYGVWYCCALSLPLDTAVFSRLDSGVEGIVLGGLATVAPPHSLSIPPSSLVLTVEWRVWSYGV